MGAHAERMKAETSRGRSSNRVAMYGDIGIEVSIEGDPGITQRWERERDKDATKQFNEQVQAWANRVNGALRAKMAAMNIGKTGQLSKSVKSNLWHFGKAIKEGQEVTSVGFSFKVQGVYVHLGVGRGYPMESGTVIKRTEGRHANLEMMRQPKDWFNSTITEHLQALSDIVYNYTGSLFVNATRIYMR